MDLVDIDQVLDNFELSEQAEEQQKAAALLESANGLKNKATASPATQANLSNSPSLPTGSSTVTTKNFIGVSQVFNSLDDYTKNVEQLHTAATQKYDEECRAVNPEHTEKPPSSNNRKPVNNYDGLEDEEASSEIHKFKEHQRKRLDSKDSKNDDSNDDDDGSEQSLSDSLTTSSSSSFSSGPSLGGMGSTVEEQTVPTTPADIEQDQIESSPLLNESSSDQQEEEEENNQNAEVEVEVKAEQREEPLETLDDIAEGLSSISLSTANSQSVVQCDATASSVLANKLETDLHTETQSTSLLSQQPENLETNRDFESSSIVPVSETCPLDTEDEQNHLNEASKNLLQAANEILALTKQPVFEEPKPPQQPITFCSTMDDISDAELDSMLQEMEIDEDQAKANEAQAEEVSVPSEPEVPEPLKTDAVTTAEVFSAKSPDHNNADSFSQASTVEFSEVKAQTNNASLPEPEVDLVQSPSSVISSYSSTEESSLEGELAGNLAEDDSLRPQRPTSLDIPNVNPALYTNAGQTPPDMCGVVQQQHEDSDDPRAEESATSSEATAPGEIAEASGYSDPHANLGKLPPIWVPDNMASGCMQCGTKFTVLKRRHHCRACGKVLCSACCSQKFKLEFLQEPESRVCIHCFLILMQRQHSANGSNGEQLGCAAQQENLMPATQPIRSPNPNNPMEYCSTIPPHCQVSAVATPPPSVIVPVGVLKKDGSYSSNSSNCSAKQGRKRKSVMFSDGIAPGSELASSLEQQWGEAKQPRRGHQQQQHGDKQGSCPNNKPGTPLKNESRNDLTTMGLVAQLFRGSIPPMAAAAAVSTASGGSGSSSVSAAAPVPSKSKQEQRSGAQAAKRVPPGGCDENGCFIPQADGMLPPLYISKGANISDYDYKEVANNFDLVTRLQSETLKFAIKSNFLVHVKIVNLKCCMNRTVINFTTSGMHHVGNDEIIILLEYEPPAKKELMLEPPLPRDIFLHLYEIYREAELGRPIAELSYTSPRQANFLGSREYGGFMYIRISFQCLQDIIVPENPFLVGILIHRHEVPWAKVFPLRLMLRLGAQYRYYPCPHISIRNRESVYAEIAQTIINFLADFRHYSYTLPTIRGMFIHMEDRQTTVMIPRNRLDDVIKAINNASDHILALGGNFSKSADGHLVCMQNTNDDKTEMYAYSTQAINIQGQPRKVTGASFIVLNEALKSSSGLSGKCSIVEDGLMVQIMPTKMEEVRNALRNQENINIVCGPIDADEQQTEIVSIKWVDNDRDFNLGVISPIDGKSMEGISSMRVHASFNYSNTNYAIRLTDIFIIKFDDWYNSAQESLNAASLDITRLAEQIARSASMALVPFLDLLAASGNTKMALRATLHQENVCYEAGAQGAKLPPLYMNALDNHLIPTLHNESTGIEEAIVLELIFYILNV